MVATADSAVSEGYRILSQLAAKAKRLFRCEKIAICFWTAGGELMVGGCAGCTALRGGAVVGGFEASRGSDGADGFTEIWEGPVIICGESLVNPAVLKIMLRFSGHLGYLIFGDRSEVVTAEDVTIGLTTAQQFASVIIEHLRPDLRRV